MRHLDTLAELAKLRQQELLEEALHAQATRRLMREARVARQWNWGVWVAAGASLAFILLLVAL